MLIKLTNCSKNGYFLRGKNVVFCSIKHKRSIKIQYIVNELLLCYVNG